MLVGQPDRVGRSAAKSRRAVGGDRRSCGVGRAGRPRRPRRAAPHLVIIARAPARVPPTPGASACPEGRRNVAPGSEDAPMCRSASLRLVPDPDGKKGSRQ